MNALRLLLAVSLVPTLAGLIAALWFGLDAAALARVLATPGIGTSIATSMWTGLASTGISLALAHLIVALAVTGQWRQRLNFLALPLLALPHLAIGIGLALVIAPSGLILRALSPWATGFDLPPDWLIVRDPAGLSLILGLVIKETCFLIMALMAALSQVDAARVQQQGAMLGYGALTAWLAGVAPQLQSQIRLPLAAVLVFGMTNVELAITLGPGLPPTFSVVLWRWFTDPDTLIHAQAYAGSLVLLVLVLVTLAIASALGNVGRRLVLRLAHSGRRGAHETPARRLAGIVVGTLWLTGLLSLLAIVIRSANGPWRFPALWPTGAGGALWGDVLPTIQSVGVTTLTLAALTALIGAALVLPAAEHCHDRAPLRRRIGIWLFVPLLLPQMTFLFGVQVVLSALHIDGTYAAVVWAHLIFALPYLWGVLAPARSALDPRYSRVAHTLGASRTRTWITVTLPMLTRATLLALALGFSVSVALYLPTLFAGAGRINTAATEAAAAAGAGSLRLAAVHAILLALAPLLAFAAAYLAGALIFRHRRGVPK